MVAGWSRPLSAMLSVDLLTPRPLAALPLPAPLARHLELELELLNPGPEDPELALPREALQLLDPGPEELALPQGRLVELLSPGPEDPELAMPRGKLVELLDPAPDDSLQLTAASLPDSLLPV